MVCKKVNTEDIVPGFECWEVFPSGPGSSGLSCKWVEIGRDITVEEALERHKYGCLYTEDESI